MCADKPTRNTGALALPSRRRTRTLKAAEIYTFSLGEIDLHVVDNDGTLWFPASEVCLALGLAGYASQHTQKLDNEDVLVLTRAQNTSQLAQLFDAKARAISLISENGLYRLVMRSDQPKARPFQDWVTREVLPAIRKTGEYAAPAPTIEPAPPAAPAVPAPVEVASVPVLQEETYIHRALELALRTLDASHRAMAEVHDALLVSHRKNEELLGREQMLTAQVEFLTVEGFKAFKRLWWSKGDTVRLANKARDIAAIRGLELSVHEYTIRNGDFVKPAKCLIYPRHLLEEAFFILGGLGSGRL